MKIQIIKPESVQLKKCIDFFYILEQTDSKKEISYLTFPNPYSIISVLENVKLKHFQNKISVSYSSSAPLVSDLTLSYTKPILISFKGKIKEISICFKPLGINYFIENSKETSFEKTSFFPYPDFEQKMTEIINLTNETEIIDQLESYLLSKISIFTHPFLYEFIHDVSDDLDISISELARKYGISQKTLIKHTKTYLNRTPSEFKKVVRFHTALNEYFNARNEVRSFTDISHAVHFFDQAHMIKDFKSLTGYTPRNFFKNLSPSEGTLNWMFL